MTSRKIVLLTLFLFLFGILPAQNVLQKANDFINSLSEEIKAKTLFSLEDTERLNMNYVPISREGATFHDFNEVQKKAALDLLRASLSEEGFRKSQEIMELEKVLRIIENNDADKMPDGRPRRDPLNYHFCIFGNPSKDQAWGWRFEGHHLSLNFTSTDGIISSATPTFFGTNPGIVRSTEYKGREVLRKEAQLGFSLLHSMTGEQLKTVIFTDVAPHDIVTTTKRKVGALESLGIPYTDLSQNQKKIFMELLDLYINNYEHGFAEEFRDKIHKAGIDRLKFAWAGSMQPGKGHYFRIQGPMLLIEYDNTQNDANHVHTVVRDLTNDYGEDVLKAHYEKDHK
ncbi:MULTISPECIES: DUF3500 domain-containing protein [unclassified Arenibacter]|jgi:hypothetical protein|uniref:DUF3500 domain-containing protein n=1 Tax=unclassified Arenibacter TaxID=2615047 RepID=UPI000E353466|nr:MULTISPECIES: DUF3500 domain-containing protein [unclassified Arenibacter]MCM4165625.1 hypothetical protein [Arenibacter sp. A80]RFT54772.1 DUF3500 domain-containing protein [Arenibacter sp. P308M17]